MADMAIPPTLTPLDEEAASLAPENGRTVSATPSSRRSLLGAALSGVAGLVLGALGRPMSAEAAAGSALIIGRTTNNAGTSNTTLTTSSTGAGLRVKQNGSGHAVEGLADGKDAFGVWAHTTGAAGDGAGLRAAGGNNHGVVASTASATKAALRASNTATAKGTGAAILAIGGKNDGVNATTSHGHAAAVRATNTGTYAGGMGGPIGVFGTATQPQGIGVVGQAPNGVGVAGTSDTGPGVDGYSLGGAGVSGASDTGPGVSGNGSAAPGVYGMAGTGHGVEAGSQDGVALYANADIGYGVYCTSGGSEALYADGDAIVTGNLSVTGSVDKAGGTFRIDHPADPSRKYLQHSFVESPDMKNVYDGTVRLDASGEATVELPAYFEALNRDARVQLTAVGSFSPLFVKAPVSKSRFTIGGGAPRQDVFWQVTGIRRDPWAQAHPVSVEVAKRGVERGRYLHPELYGEPPSKAIGAALSAKAGRPSSRPTP